MKKIIHLITLLFLTSIYAQPIIEWQKCLGGTNFDSTGLVVQILDGGYIIAGATYSNDGDVSNNNGISDIWVVKLSSLGTLEWENNYGGTEFESISFIEHTMDGGYIISGATESNDGDVSSNHGELDAWILKISSEGVIEWQKSLGGSGIDLAHNIKQTLDGGYIVAGLSHSNDGDLTVNHGLSDVWVLKLSNLGVIEWQKSFGGSQNDYTGSIFLTQDGGIIVAGGTESNDGDVLDNHGETDVWLLKLSSLGNLEWQKSLGGSNYERPSSILQTSDAGFILTAQSNSNDGDVSGNHGLEDIWVVKLTNTGSIEWQKSFGGTGIENPETILQILDGGYIISGRSTSNDGDVSGNHGEADAWIIKITNNGTVEWQKCYGGSNTETSIIKPTLDGGFVFGGSTNSNDGDVSGNHGFYDGWIVKLSSILSINKIVKNKTILLYPNPVKNNLHFRIDSQFLQKPFIIYNLLGKKVKNGDCTKKDNRIDVSELKQGIYFIKIGKKDMLKFIKK